jgi:hypothetical protein
VGRIAGSGYLYHLVLAGSQRVGTPQSK